MWFSSFIHMVIYTHARIIDKQKNDNHMLIIKYLHFRSICLIFWNLILWEINFKKTVLSPLYNLGICLHEMWFTRLSYYWINLIYCLEILNSNPLLSRKWSLCKSFFIDLKELQYSKFWMVISCEIQDTGFLLFETC